MPRARNIKPGFFTDEDVVELPFETRLLFIGLWTIADREGRLHDKPKQIKMHVFPADDVDVEASLQALCAVKLIERYVVRNERFIQVVNFVRHQNPHSKEAASTILAPCKPRASTRRAVLIPDSPLLDSPNPNGEGFSEKLETDLPSYLPGSSIQRKDGFARSTLAVNGNAQMELEEWLDAVAPKLGAKNRNTIADFQSWESVCIKAISDDIPLGDFLDSVDAERERTRETPQFFTPKGVLKIVQANKSKPTVKGFLH